MNSDSTPPHLAPQYWDRANRLLVRKAIAEFSHERLLSPEEPAPGHYCLRSDDQRSEYLFSARKLALNHWQVDPDSLARTKDGVEKHLDALEFMVDFHRTLGVDTLPLYLEEISSTLASMAFKLSLPERPAADLARADFQTIEAAMAEGHPCFLANSGRIGFGVSEYLSYAPEAATPVRLIWLAVHQDRSTFSASEGLGYDELIRSELDTSTLAGFTARIGEFGLDPNEYHLIPVHPWQWNNKLSVTFAADVARRDIVCLGTGDDEYLAQQSIRTFFNISNPQRSYVKTSLSVLNMGFMRGLSTEYMKATPAINDWVSDLFAEDEVLRQYPVDVLREKAALGYHPEQYEAAAAKGSPYLKMLAALWRQSPTPFLEPGQRPATMASLLHVDRAGDTFVGRLIAESGLSPQAWLRKYLDAYLAPLLHCFYAYGLVFMPHGENVILVLEHGVPKRVLLKDIGEEVAVMSRQTPLPDEVERIRAEVPEHLHTLSIFTDVFDCFFRFLSAVLVTDGAMDEETFWFTVASCVRDYQESVPHLAEQFERYDLFAEQFDLSCLNRLQLRDSSQMVDLQDPSGALQLVGRLDNPIARFAPGSESRREDDTGGIRQ
ncbi:IucA/IucC family protein [Haloactinomyces albus]|uniref:Siderophore synthetase component n=1 Tax=Haloactinomyces albus TaxID=1352928 RepID=A0AAE4CRU9_9ACTN|nr:IucA/IucC family siderophore biosynthesis protein [Haloactinomyces albus]MDR7304063.1 siderophore synthetase component [Haloactinomyces albus]